MKFKYLNMVLAMKSVFELPQCDVIIGITFAYRNSLMAQYSSRWFRSHFTHRGAVRANVHSLSTLFKWSRSLEALMHGFEMDLPRQPLHTKSCCPSREPKPTFRRCIKFDFSVHPVLHVFHSVKRLFVMETPHVIYEFSSHTHIPEKKTWIAFLLCWNCFKNIAS